MNETMQGEREALAELREQLAAGEASDGYHTHRELYEYRMLYNAHAARGWLAAGIPVVKSRRHSDGEPCFGGGWFIVVAELPAGQVSNHYRDEHWELFDVPAVELPPEYDGHTPADASDRLAAALLREGPALPAPAPEVDLQRAFQSEIEGRLTTRLATAMHWLTDQTDQLEITDPYSGRPAEVEILDALKELIALRATSAEQMNDRFLAGYDAAPATPSGGVAGALELENAKLRSLLSDASMYVKPELIREWLAAYPSSTETE